ncbi:MAG: hypothetical protein KME42_09165 [Tildeniella nuda ZEHNDER 1965/U140]|nr:hypothetical protein [Tildeniella nuda ZEHNDER 1965/U140]
MALGFAGKNTIAPAILPRTIAAGLPSPAFGAVIVKVCQRRRSFITADNGCTLLECKAVASASGLSVTAFSARHI